MRQPRDIDAELKTLQDRQKQLKAPCTVQNSGRSSQPPAPMLSIPRRWPGRSSPQSTL